MITGFITIMYKLLIKNTNFSHKFIKYNNYFNTMQILI